MKAMVLNQLVSLKENDSPLTLVDLPIPRPKPKEVLIKISVCGVCHTELDEIEGRILPIELPIVPGHQVVGTIAATGTDSNRFAIGERIGVAWIFSACGNCRFCLREEENLCDRFLATGLHRNGGYAEYMVADERYVYPIPPFFSDAEAAPLLCAGAIGYRSLKLCKLKDGDRLGLTGFGASAHLVLKMAKHLYPKTKIFVFAREEKERQFAKSLGADWVGDTTDRSPEKPDAMIDTTPVWKPIVEALANLEKGGRLIINAIRKEDVDKEYLQLLSYKEHLWMEKEIKSVANITAADVSEFLELAAKAAIKPEFEVYSLEDANRALMALKTKNIRGAKVLQVRP
jgi:propanol-preferring alcohol dehydrogenase